VNRLYHREGAGRPRRVRWALEEAGAPYDLVVMTQEEGQGEEHARRHPLGRVPVLETEDGTLFESAALCLQVADLHPEADLIPPPGSFERGQVYQWSIFAMSELEPTLIRAHLARRESDTDAQAKADARLDKTFAAVENALEGRDYIVGRFTVADVVLGGVLESARRFEILPSSPNILAYLARLDARPAKQVAYA
jgi:glutathione S-transferase